MEKLKLNIIYLVILIASLYPALKINMHVYYGGIENDAFRFISMVLTPIATIVYYYFAFSFVLNKIKKESNKIDISKADYYFLKNLKDILNKGTYDENPRPKYEDGTPAHTKFITQVFEEYDLSKGEYPIISLRPNAIKTGIKEIFWIYQKQDSNLSTARNMGINWWDEWDIGDGTIGLRYGATVKKWNIVNDFLDGIKKDPFGRRHIMNLYVKSDFNKTKGLHPCAYETIFSCRKENDGKIYLDMTLVQRSSDYIVAGYINKIQYVALQHMIASHFNFNVGKFCHLVQNLHIYDRHFEAANEILNKRRPEKNTNYRIGIKKESIGKNFYDYTLDDFYIESPKVKPLNAKLPLAI